LAAVLVTRKTALRQHHIAADLALALVPVVLQLADLERLVRDSLADLRFKAQARTQQVAVVALAL
jgi:hypothetical protein